ncbi:hypothetical protein NL676_015796 [Syzygium grande]|nr:hypothetical protein NL676_015796 [Syzygium grande]
MASTIGLLNAAIVKLHSKRGQALKLLDLVACMSYTQIAWFHMSKAFPLTLLQLVIHVLRVPHPIWPPKSFKDSGSRFHSQLKEAIAQTGMEKNLFGNHPVVKTEAHGPPHASDLSVTVSSSSAPSMLTDGTYANGPSSDIVEIDVPSSAGNFMKSSSPVGPGATTRKGAFQVDRQNSDMSYYADDEDGNKKKYSRRGPFRHKFLRLLLPFWSSALPTLPVTAPPRKDSSNADDAPEGRTRHQRQSRMDPRKMLLVIAIMACLATMGILYYRIAQRGFADDLHKDEQQ